MLPWQQPEILAACPIFFFGGSVTKRWQWWAGAGEIPMGAPTGWGTKATWEGMRRTALPRQEEATWKPERTTRPAWWTVWFVATSLVVNTMVSSHVRAARASSRGVSDVTSATHAGERGIMGILCFIDKTPDSLASFHQISPQGGALHLCVFMCLSHWVNTNNSSLT